MGPQGELRTPECHVVIVVRRYVLIVTMAVGRGLQQIRERCSMVGPVGRLGLRAGADDQRLRVVVGVVLWGVMPRMFVVPRMLVVRVGMGVPRLDIWRGERRPEGLWSLIAVARRAVGSRAVGSRAVTVIAMLQREVQPHAQRANAGSEPNGQQKGHDQAGGCSAHKIRLSEADPSRQAKNGRAQGGRKALPYIKHQELLLAVKPKTGGRKAGARPSPTAAGPRYRSGSAPTPFDVSSPWHYLRPRSLRPRWIPNRRPGFHRFGLGPG